MKAASSSILKIVHTAMGLPSHTYLKIRFTSALGTTDPLVISGDRFSALTVGELSRLFPYSDAPSMEIFEASPVYETEAEAVAYEFSSDR